MKGKILFAAGLAVGYVLGTRAGRERYEQMKRAANGFWNDPRVQRRSLFVHLRLSYNEYKQTAI